MSDSCSRSLLTLSDVACERDERYLYSSVSMTICSGQIWHIKGANGVGKTSLLRQIAGLLPLDQGAITWSDDVAMLYIGHHLALKDNLSADENLTWLTALSQPTTPSQRAEALVKTGLVGFGDHMVGDMSAGQKRRVALSRLHCQKANIWLLDEPFTAIDQEGVDNQHHWFGEHIAQGGAIVMTSHQHITMTDVQVLRLDDFTPRNKESS